MNRAKDWFDQAKNDLLHAKNSMIWTKKNLILLSLLAVFFVGTLWLFLQIVLLPNNLQKKQ